MLYLPQPKEVEDKNASSAAYTCFPLKSVHAEDLCLDLISPTKDSDAVLFLQPCLP